MHYELGVQAAFQKLGLMLPPRAPGIALPQRAIDGREALQRAAQSLTARKALRSPEELAALALSRPRAPLETINPAARMPR